MDMRIIGARRIRRVPYVDTSRRVGYALQLNADAILANRGLR
jgi:hypothetical protein